MPADLPALGRLGAVLVRVHHAIHPDLFIAPAPQTEPAYAAFLDTQLRDPDVLLLVAELDGAVVGYAYAAVEGHDDMSLRGPTGVLHDLIVDPTARTASARVGARTP